MIARMMLLAVAACAFAVPVSTPAGDTHAADTTTYYFGILKRGPNRSQPADEAQKIQTGHLQHIGDMARSGKLVAAGPFGDDGDMRGILLFKTASADEAIALESTDPAVVSGRLVHEVHPWVGPSDIGAGYVEKLETTKADQIPMVTYQMVFLSKGAHWTDATSAEHAAVAAAHHDYVSSLMDSHKIVVAGPFVDNGVMRGVAILNVATPDEAVSLVSADPAVKAGYLAVDVHPWWCAKYVMPE